MVSLKSSFIVKPADPTNPNVRRLRLMECDQVQGLSHAPTIYIYRVVADMVGTASLDILKNSLSQALVHFFPLAGRLECIGGGRFQIHCNDMGAHFFEAESEAQIDDFGDFSPTPEIKELVPRVNYATDIKDLPLLLVQLTRFRCGGICLGVALSHIVSDGLASLHFISSWAKIARGENLDVLPFHDRTVFCMCDPLAAPRFDHVEFNHPPLLIGQDNTDEERRKEIITATLKLTEGEVEKIKKKANESRTEDESRSYGRYEAIAGHLWRCACKARKHQTEQLTALRVAVDCRSRLRPSLSQGYFGNAIIVTTPIAKSGEIGSKTLGYASKKIREAVKMVNDDYVRSSIDFLRSQSDMSSFRAPFHTTAGSTSCTQQTQGVFRGNPNLVATSWLGLPIYDADFGWGKPIHMGPASIGFDGKCYIIPGRDGDGSLMITIGLQVAHMDDFKKFFYQDM